MTNNNLNKNKLIKTIGEYTLISLNPVIKYNTHEIRKNGKILTKNGPYSRYQAVIWFNNHLKNINYKV